MAFESSVVDGKATRVMILHPVASEQRPHSATLAEVS